LIFPSLFIETHPPAADDVKAILWNETESAGLHLKEDGSDLAEIIFQSEVDVFRGRDPKVRNLTFDPDIGKLQIENVFDLLCKLGDGEYISERELQVILHKQG
jgi:hypothetical protein